MPSRGTVRLLLECDNRCVFCAQEGLATPAPSVEEQLARARADSDAVTFVGGEPTLDPALAQHVARARALGFTRVGLQTNGRRLAGDGYAGSLARAGLTDVHLSIHGAEPAVHDYHAGVAGAFEAALAGFAAARANGLAVAVTTVLTRSNFRALGTLPRLLSARGAAGWLVLVPHVAGRAAASFDRVVPRLGLALPFAIHAIDQAETLGLAAWIGGAPACLLGPYATRALPGAPGRAYGAACEGCLARPVCPGVDPAYLGRFGGDELVARPRPGAAAQDRAELVAMFVESEMTDPRPVVDGPVETRKVMLPLLGKVKPAHAEVTASAPRRSGEALKEILPALFEEPGERPAR
jgi:radical SAM family protein